MALKLERKYNGMSCDYWKIVEAHSNYETDQTIVTVGLYKDEECRQDSVNNILEHKKMRLSGVDLTRAEMYTKLKEPMHYGDIGMDDNGETFVGQHQTNPFVDATDI